MRVESDDSAITEILDRLRDVVLAEGGGFSKNIRAVIRDGDLSVRANAETPPRERAMSIPTQCLPPCDPFDLAVDGDRFVARQPDPDVPEPAKRCFHLMVELYNACGKPAFWRRTTPWLALRQDPELLDAMTETRAGAVKVEKLRELARTGAESDILVQTFLGSRIFRLQPPSPSETGTGVGEDDGAQDISGSTATEDAKTVLMPFVDFLNHDLRAASYHVAKDDDGVRRLWTGAECAMPDSDECFVRYSLVDALETWMVYGFVDESAAFFTSVPLTIHLPEDQQIVVEAFGTTPFEGQLPPQMSDVRPYVPLVIGADEHGFSLSRLIIPGPQAPRALRRVLTFFLRRIGVRYSEAVLRHAVESAENQILRANRSVLDRLRAKLAEAHAAPPADPPAGRAEALTSLCRALDHFERRLDGYCDDLGLQRISPST